MSREGMSYALQGKPGPVVAAGEFPFAAVRLDHGHIYGQCNGLVEACSPRALPSAAREVIGG